MTNIKIYLKSSYMFFSIIKLLVHTTCTHIKRHLSYLHTKCSDFQTIYCILIYKTGILFLQMHITNCKCNYRQSKKQKKTSLFGVKNLP